MRLRVKEIVGQGRSARPGFPPFTPAAGEVLHASNEESVQRGLDHIGTEHILLGLVRDREGVAAQALVTQGAGLDDTRRSTDELVQRYPAR